MVADGVVDAILEVIQPGARHERCRLDCAE
jgi:hypothetical protein